MCRQLSQPFGCAALARGSAQVEELSATNRALVAELVDVADVVYPLAAAVGVELIVESPARTIDTNVHCTEVLLDQAAKKHKPVFVASTSEVYGKSNNVRSSLSGIAADVAASSPVIGYGDTRHELGSANSIAVGKTVNCHTCGSRDIGGNGQLWLLFICEGFVGAGLYCGFFIYGIFRYWRDPTPYGLAGVLVLILSFPFMLVYVAVGPPLAFTMLAYSLLWKNDRAINQERAEAAAARLNQLGSPGSQLAVAT